MSKLFIIFAVILAFASGYWYWTTTPEYSLNEIRAAIKHHDVARFEKHVDLNKIATNLVDSLAAKPADTTRAFGPAAQIIGLGLMGLIKPSLVRHMKAELIQMVEENENLTNPAPGGFAKPSKSSLKRALKHLGFSGKIYQGIDYQHTSGRLARLGLLLHNKRYNRDFTLELAMRNMGGYWRLEELSNLPNLITMMIEWEMEHLQGSQTPSHR